MGWPYFAIVFVAISSNLSSAQAEDTLQADCSNVRSREFRENVAFFQAIPTVKVDDKGIDVSWPPLPEKLEPCLEKIHVSYRDLDWNREMKNLTLRNPDGTPRQSTRLLYDDIRREFQIVEGEPPTYFQLSVAVSHKGEARGPGGPFLGVRTFVPFKVGTCAEGKLGYIRYSLPKLKRLSYDVKEKTGEVKVTWREPDCSPELVEGYTLAFWEERNNVKNLLETDNSTTEATVSLDMEKTYYFQVLTKEAGKKTFLSSDVAKTEVVDCSKGPEEFPRYKISQSEWNGNDSLAKIRVDLTYWARAGPETYSAPLDGCVKGLAVSYKPDHGPGTSQGLGTLAQMIDKDERSIEVEIPSNEAVLVTLAVVSAGAREGQTVMTVAPEDARQKSHFLFRASPGGGCFESMENRPEMNSPPEIHVNQTEARDRFEISVYWNMTQVENADCLERFLVRTWATYSSSGRLIEKYRSYSEEYYMSSSLTTTDQSAMSDQFTKSWELESGQQIHAQVIPLVLGEDYVGEALRGEIRGVHPSHSNTFEDKVSSYTVQ